MFTNIFKKLFRQNPDLNKQTFFKSAILNNLIGDKLVFFKKNNFSLTTINELIEYKNEKQIRYELNKQFFYIKQDFLFNFKFNTQLFKNEWNNLFDKNLNLHSAWLIYTRRPLYIMSNLFYFRNKNLFKTFNSLNINIGKYTKKYNYNYKNIYWGFLSFIKILRIWLFSLSIFLISFYVLIVKRTCVLPQTLFFWVGVSMLLYWLLSGFVFFVKKYQYSRFTSVIQRFWRRSYILFWLIESGLLLVFFYLTVNSTQESFYMFDQGYFLKTHLFSWKLFLFKCILVVSLITYSYLLLLNLKWSYFNKNILSLIILTILLLYLVWTEFYQIYWVSNFYANFSWLFDTEELVWFLEIDARRTRILNHYVMVLFLLKFWHIVFIFGCWIFFLLRSNELDTITYPLYSFNFQNFIILFLMMWLFMYPWFKHTYHWLAEIPYYWFYVDTHMSFVKILINDLYQFYYNCYLSLFNSLKITFVYTKFINWYLLDEVSNLDVFIKSTIKNEILKKFSF